jgi:hypothetical protein
MSGDLDRNPLWGVLVETAHSLPLYKSHKNYVQEHILPSKPDIKPEELVEKLGMPLGEALVILDELDHEKPKKD